MRLILSLALIAAFLSVALPAHAEVHKVTDLKTLAALCAEKANPGDVIEIQPGTYTLDVPAIKVFRSGTPEAPVIIRGVMQDGKRPVIDACKINVKRGILYVEQEVHDLVIENLELCNAAGGGNPGDEFPRNAAGVYVLGSNVTIRNCAVHHCENGLFSTHESDFVLVENCDIGFNGRKLGVGERFRTHNFYFNSKHQMVKNCYIHDATDSENFKSRGGNNIFAFNWVDEECAYSVAVDSGNEQNTLWLGNVVVKRTYDGINQGRLLGVGDGTGVAKGTLVALNNTFITIFPRDFYLFTEESSTCDVILMNNVFAGPGKTFIEKNGQGKIAGTNNWIQKDVEGIPEGLEKTLSGEDAGFAGAEDFDFNLKASSPLAGAGAGGEKYLEAVKLVTQYSRAGEGAQASPIWLKALDEIEKPAPACEPLRKAAGVKAREAAPELSIGAYELAPKKK